MLAVFVTIAGAPTHLPFLLVPVHTAPLLSARTHSHPLVHTGSLTHTPAYVPSLVSPNPPEDSLGPRPLTLCSLHPRLLSHIPFLPLPHLFLLTNKPPLAYPCALPPSTPGIVCFCSHLPMHLNMLTFQCMHTRLLLHFQMHVLPIQLVLGSQNLCTDTEATPVRAS